MGVNLIALPRRFVKISDILIWISPRCDGYRQEIPLSRVISFSAATGLRVSVTSLAMVAKSKFLGLSLIPASILERSRRSLISRARRSAFDLMRTR